MNEYEDIIDHIYDDCELMGLDIDTMIHEMGAAQLEVNFIHGDPLKLADQVFLSNARCGQWQSSTASMHFHGEPDGRAARQRHAYPPVGG